jgi:hypothetical protein
MTKLQTYNLIKDLCASEKTKEWKPYLRKMNDKVTFILYLTNHKVSHSCVCYMILKEESANTVAVSFDFEAPYVESPDDNIPGAWNLGEKMFIEDEKLTSLKEPSKTKLTVDEICAILDKYVVEFKKYKANVDEKQAVLFKSHELVTDLKMRGVQLVKKGDVYTGTISTKDNSIKVETNVKTGSFIASFTVSNNKAIDLVKSHLVA